MAWKYGSVTLKEGSSWTDDNGIKHPTNWSIWTETYKKNVFEMFEDGGSGGGGGIKHAYPPQKKTENVNIEKVLFDVVRM